MRIALPALIAAAVLPLPSRLAAQGSFQLQRASDCTLGGSIRFDFAGVGQPLLVLAASTTAASTPLPPAISSRPLDIGPSLLVFAEVVATPAGTSTAIPVPNDLLLEGLLLHWQAAAMPGASTLVDALSNRVAVQLAQPTVPTTLTTTAVGKAWAARIHRPDVAGGPGTWLFAGGATRLTIQQQPLTTTDVFDPLTLTVSAGPQLPDDVYAMTATALLDGRTLLTGGVTTLPGPQQPPLQDATAGAVVYDPATDAFLAVPPMATPRFLHAAARLPDGRVVVVGGTAVADLASPFPLSSCEVFDPSSSTWSPGPALPAPWFWGTLSTLPNGEVLLHGGLELTAFGLVPAPTCRRLVGTLGGALAWQPGAPMQFPRVAHDRGTTLLDDGRLLVAGGCVAGLVGGVPALVASPATETYDFATGTWTAHAAAPIAFFSGSLDQLPNGTVVAAGGMAGGLASAPISVQPLATLMSWTPGTATWQLLAPMQQARLVHGAVVGSDGVLTLLGGQMVAGAGPGNTAVERIVP